jgi:hypothetical protein
VRRGGESEGEMRLEQDKEREDRRRDEMRRGDKMRSRDERVRIIEY